MLLLKAETWQQLRDTSGSVETALPIGGENINTVTSCLRLDKHLLLCVQSPSPPFSAMLSGSFLEPWC